jgi:hypothetical protein
LGAFLGAAPRRFDAGASCAKLRFNAAIRSMTAGGAAISLGFDRDPSFRLHAPEAILRGLMNPEPGEWLKATHPIF